jgi:hypothetical protein
MEQSALGCAVSPELGLRLQNVYVYIHGQECLLCPSEGSYKITLVVTWPQAVHVRMAATDISCGYTLSTHQGI